MSLTTNQQLRLANWNYIQWAAGILGAISGLFYAYRTGGGFWRYVGYWILGSIILSLPAAVITLPFKNKILKEADA